MLTMFVRKTVGCLCQMLENMKENKQEFGN